MFHPRTWVWNQNTAAVVLGVWGCIARALHSIGRNLHFWNFKFCLSARVHFGLKFFISIPLRPGTLLGLLSYLLVFLRGFSWCWPRRLRFSSVLLYSLLVISRAIWYPIFFLHRWKSGRCLCLWFFLWRLVNSFLWFDLNLISLRLFR